MGVGREGPCPSPPWIFIHDTDKVELGLMVLSFNLVFVPPPLKIFLPAPFYENEKMINLS